MTIKLSNKHHPAMFPNADCGRARRESESGGSRIVSSHFDAELKKLAKKEEESNVCHERRREERQRRRRGERGGGAKHANTVSICTPSFVSLVVRLITFIEPDQELNLWTGGALKPQTGSFPVCAVNAGCGAEIKRF